MSESVSNPSTNILEAIYQSVKDLVDASVHDMHTITGKRETHALIHSVTALSFSSLREPSTLLDEEKNKHLSFQIVRRKGSSLAKHELVIFRFFAFRCLLGTTHLSQIHSS
jgi:hypothetical protein